MAGFKTARLVLRPWIEADRQPLRDLNASPQVCRYFPSTLSTPESDGMFDYFQASMQVKQPCVYAVQDRETGDFVGLCGLHAPDFDAPFMPCVEILWRFCESAWGQGYATEAAKACLSDGLSYLNIPEIVAFTVPDNTASIRVIEKIGMTRDRQGDFDHPHVSDGHPLKRHLLYRVKSPAS